MEELVKHCNWTTNLDYNLRREKAAQQLQSLLPALFKLRNVQRRKARWGTTKNISKLRILSPWIFKNLTLETAVHGMLPFVLVSKFRCINNNLKAFEKVSSWFRPVDIRKTNFVYSKEDKMPFRTDCQGGFGSWSQDLVHTKHTFLLPGYTLSREMCFNIWIMLHIKQKYLHHHHSLLHGTNTSLKFPVYQGPWFHTCLYAAWWWMDPRVSCMPGMCPTGVHSTL